MSLATEGPTNLGNRWVPPAKIFQLEHKSFQAETNLAVLWTKFPAFKLKTQRFCCYLRLELFRVPFLEDPFLNCLLKEQQRATFWKHAQKCVQLNSKQKLNVPNDHLSLPTWHSQVTTQPDTLKSQANANSKPPPRAAPSIAAIEGTSSSDSCVVIVRIVWLHSLYFSSSRLFLSLRSAPVNMDVLSGLCTTFLFVGCFITQTPSQVVSLHKTVSHAGWSFMWLHFHCSCTNRAWHTCTENSTCFALDDQGSNTLLFP